MVLGIDVENGFLLGVGELLEGGVGLFGVCDDFGVVCCIDVVFELDLDIGCFWQGDVYGFVGQIVVQCFVQMEVVVGKNGGVDYGK